MIAHEQWLFLGANRMCSQFQHSRTGACLLVLKQDEPY